MAPSFCRPNAEYGMRNVMARIRIPHSAFASP
jgi:hypothetical protein